VPAVETTALLAQGVWASRPRPLGRHASVVGPGVLAPYSGCIKDCLASAGCFLGKIQRVGQEWDEGAAYKPDLQFRYVVNGQEFRGTRIRFG